MNNITQNYRKHGALFSMLPKEASELIDRGLANWDTMGDEGFCFGVRVHGDKIDRHIPSETPILRLVGGVNISRGEIDRIESIVPIDISIVKEES